MFQEYVLLNANVARIFYDDIVNKYFLLETHPS